MGIGMGDGEGDFHVEFISFSSLIVCRFSRNLHYNNENGNENGETSVLEIMDSVWGREWDRRWLEV